MLVAFELSDLCISHGETGIVSGFDHSALDAQIQGYEQHWFPYRLADYRKTRLTEPGCIAILNYAADSHIRQQDVVHLNVSAEGRLDCVAVYVNYSLGFELPDVDMAEASHYKPNLKFVPRRRVVKVGESICVRVSEFTNGDSEFKIDVE